MKYKVIAVNVQKNGLLFDENKSYKVEEVQQIIHDFNEQEGQTLVAHIDDYRLLTLDQLEFEKVINVSWFYYDPLIPLANADKDFQMKWSYPDQEDLSIQIHHKNNHMFDLVVDLSTFMKDDALMKKELETAISKIKVCLSSGSNVGDIIHYYVPYVQNVESTEKFWYRCDVTHQGISNGYCMLMHGSDSFMFAMGLEELAYLESKNKGKPYDVFRFQNIHNENSKIPYFNKFGELFTFCEDCEETVQCPTSGYACKNCLNS